MKKISEFLSDVDPWGIYESDQMKFDFKEQTGLDGDWPEFTHKETAKAMQQRGLGGSLVPGTKMLCYGYTTAIHLAQKHVPGFHSTKTGRGFAFSEAVLALHDAGF
jgi:hypothetical protein